jgi:hypothetical protein
MLRSELGSELGVGFRLDVLLSAKREIDFLNFKTCVFYKIILSSTLHI